MRKLWWMQQGPLRMALMTGGTGGGAGAGAGAGADPNAGGGGASVPNFEDWSKKLLEEFDKRTNAFDKKFNKILERLEAGNGGNGNGGAGGTEPNAGGGTEPNAGGAGAEPLKESKTIADLNVRIQQLERSGKSTMDEMNNWKKKAAEEEQKRLEAERQGAFDAAIEDIPFASPKAKQQFRSAYLGQVKRDEDGTYIVETDKGPMSASVFLHAEADASPHFLQPQGQGGAGASGSKKVGGGGIPDILSMKTEDILKMSPEQQSAAMRDLNTIAMSGR